VEKRGSGGEGRWRWRSKERDGGGGRNTIIGVEVAVQEVTFGGNQVPFS